ncbi:glycoside hydrolase family 18 /Carbohydrate-binding module family 1 [Cryphonectria parasitica EP155]|uniref:chitinase n=1 Tax=Cryphonectria parasitica (strain ATCC 38755 / EP155) TaxID=660469 RepID=A0A9P4XXG5_CRYP1|nr:glycoside hydrolase family 18 /Carbohydrate-binding module family 1 [Cryphonectria parasitica EP155]KAF3762656.1 glycoside hydrolase family 18 /Carbohydrate-binding module family 1 [Cryphonectria parasitica EP155]
MFTTLASLVSLAGVVSAVGQNVVYWGQNGGGTIENNDLSTYCTSTSGIDILVLAFLYEFGISTGDIPSGTIGQSCFISSSNGEGQDCDALAAAISTCQDAGVTIILSIGGASGSYSLENDAQAEVIGQYLWDSYGNSGNTTVERPFGDVFVNGFDFDIELNDGYSQYYPAMISTLRANFETDPDNTYYITGAPQCPIPEPNMGVIIGNATFDYLWVQWYNNNNYSADPCALPFNGNAPFNYDDWVSYTATTPSADAEIFIGVPAAPLAANGGTAGETYYITPDQLAELIDEYEDATRFGGIMMWSAGFSDSNVNDGCTYAQEAHAILEYGSPCANGPSSVSIATTAPLTTLTTSTTTSVPVTGVTTTTTTAASGTGTPLAEWAQCGGEGYTGSTYCESPYSCVCTSVWWCQCE